MEGREGREGGRERERERERRERERERERDQRILKNIEVPPVCDYGVVCRRWVAGTARNRGRAFWGCYRGRVSGNFFTGLIGFWGFSFWVD